MVPNARRTMKETGIIEAQRVKLLAEQQR